MATGTVKRVAVTGAGGFIGGNIVRYFRAHGWNVTEMTRRGGSGPDNLAFSLDEPLTDDALRGVDALIHCAYDFGPRTQAEIDRSNVDGTRRLFASAKKTGVETIVFISSVSSYAGCQSLYGQAKFAIEQDADTMGFAVVRPGLVYGKNSGGIMGRMQKAATSGPVVPLIGSGNDKQCLVHVEDLCKLLLKLCDENWKDGHPITAASKTLWTFREIVAELAKARNRKPNFLPVPWRLVWGGLKLLESAGLRPEFRSDSVLGAVKYNPALDWSATDKAGVSFRPFRAEEL